VSFSARTRRLVTVWAALSLAFLVALALTLTLNVRALRGFDRNVGDAAYSWVADKDWLVQLLLGVDAVFGTLPLAVYTVLAAAALTYRKHPRAAMWTIGVMTAAALTTTVLKQVFDRARPVWEDPLQSLDSFSFPSGHASGIASAAGVVLVLTALLVRRSGTRRVITVVALLLVVVVGADRVLLGVHHLSDVLAGYAVGMFWALTAIVLFDPTPRSQVAKKALPSVVPDTNPMAVILNPSKIENVAGFKSLVHRMALDSEWGAPTWYETTVEDPGRGMAEKAAISGAELVLVCGGDGTVRTVCGELAGTGIPVGIVPAGTGNLLARNLGVPLYLQAAVDVALNGRDRAIDVVKLSGDGIPDESAFMVMAGMGFDAAIIEDTNEQIKAKVGWLAYVVSGMKNLMFPAVRVEISVDDGPWTRHRARTVVIGNVGYLQAGMPLLPDAAIDDGILDVVILHPRRFLSWFRLALRVLSKRKRVDDMVNRMTGRTVSIRTGSAIPRQLDGDSIGPGKALNAECEHGRLLVRVPR
jgi:YegS/Rv2252/BmrU family lipid kinase